MDDPVPLRYVRLDLGRADADTIAPKVHHLPDLKFQIGQLSVGIHFVSVLHKLEIELIEVGGYVNALELWIGVLVDEDEVRINLKTSILTHN